QTKVRQWNFRSDLSFVPAACIYNLTEPDVLVVRRNRPQDEALARGRFLQLVETHLDLSRSVFPRRDENVRARACQRTREVDFDFGVIARFVSRDIEQWRRVSRLGF